MSSTQRIIKYLATAFAIFLVVTIIFGVINAVFSLGNLFDDSNQSHKKLEGININEDVSVLDIDVKSVKIIFKEGEKLLAKTNNKNINVRQDRNKLFITQKQTNWFNNDNNELIIYIPKEFTFDGVSINAGAGNVTIDELLANMFYLEVGAGKVEIEKLTVLNSTEIDGGAGKMVINNGSLNNLDLDMGVGQVTLNALITGRSQIDCGVGSVDLNLIGNINDYKIGLDKGIGSAILDGESMKDDTYYGTGENFIDIDGGIGSIKINFN